MGGFSPPVPTAATVNSGVRTTTHQDSATTAIRDVSTDIQFEHSDPAPLLALTKAVRGKVAADNMKIEMFFVPDFPRDLTLEAAVTAGAAAAVITEYTRLIAGMQILNARTNEVFSVTTTPGSTTVAIGGRSGAAAMNAGDPLRIISTAQEEVHSLPAIRSQQETTDYNYLQYFEWAWGWSKVDAASSSYLGKDPVVERKKAMVFYNQMQEEAFINGNRYYSATGGGVNSSKLWYTGGCRQFISSNVWNLGGNEPTESQLFEYLGYIFEFGEGGYSKGGTAKKIAFCSPWWLALLERFNKSKLQMEQISDKIGMKVATMQCTVGDLIVKLHPLFAKPGYRDKMLILDLNHIKYRYLNGMDTTIEENVETPGDSVKKHHIFSVCGLEFNGDERAHGWIEGGPVAA